MSTKKEHTLIALNRASQDIGNLYDKIDELLAKPADHTIGTDVSKSTFEAAIWPEDILYQINEEVVNGFHKKLQAIAKVVTSIDEDKQQYLPLSITAEDVSDWTSKALEEGFGSDYPTLLAHMGERYAEEAYNEAEEDAPLEMANLFLKMLKGHEHWIPAIINELKKKQK